MRCTFTHNRPLFCCCFVPVRVFVLIYTDDKRPTGIVRFGVKGGRIRPTSQNDVALQHENCSFIGEFFTSTIMRRWLFFWPETKELAEPNKESLFLIAGSRLSLFSLPPLFELAAYQSLFSLSHILSLRARALQHGGGGRDRTAGRQEVVT